MAHKAVAFGLSGDPQPRLPGGMRLDGQHHHPARGAMRCNRLHPQRPPQLVEQAAAWGDRLAANLDDTKWLVQDALRRGDHVLLEGAQGTLLELHARHAATQFSQVCPPPRLRGTT